MGLLQKVRHLFVSRAIVLMYHRIADLTQDPWQLAVSPANFEQQLQVLQKSGKVISVKELVTGIYNNKIIQNSICLTFDDGYSDNYLEAKPLLEKYQVPASFFIPTQYPGQQKQFWWDELQDIILTYPSLPGKISLLIRQNLLEFELGDDSSLTPAKLELHNQWVWPAIPPTRRCELYLAIWEHVKPLYYDEIQSVLAAIKEWALFKEPVGTDSFPMSKDQLQDIVNHPFIDLGSHTVTHPALSFHSREVQQTEMVKSKIFLEEICGRSVETIAFPYGDCNEITLALAKDLDLKAAFTTRERVVTSRTDPYQIGRFHVKDINGADFARDIVKWQQSAQFL